MDFITKLKEKMRGHRDTAEKLQKVLDTTPCWRFLKREKLEEAIRREKRLASYALATLLMGQDTTWPRK